MIRVEKISFKYFKRPIDVLFKSKLENHRRSKFCALKRPFETFISFYGSLLWSIKQIFLSSCLKINSIVISYVYNFEFFGCLWFSKFLKLNFYSDAFIIRVRFEGFRFVRIIVTVPFPMMSSFLMLIFHFFNYNNSRHNQNSWIILIWCI